jgi:hypothetical protein
LYPVRGWKEFNSLYPTALIVTNEVVPNAEGFANTTPKERGAFWHLHNAQRNGAGRYFEFVKAAKQAVAGGVGVQP